MEDHRQKRRLRHRQRPGRPEWFAVGSALRIGWRFLTGHATAIRVLLIYGVTMVILLTLYALLDDTAVLERFLGVNAYATGFLVGLFGTDAVVANNQLLTPGFGINIVQECTSLTAFAVFSAAVVAYPARWSWKLLGMGMGFMALWAINLVRTTSLFYIGLHYPTALDVAHHLVWQSAMVVFSVTIWLVWMRRSADRYRS